ncbi:MAG: cell division protein FtsA [bacterium (Candidatus Ratteibacteria) CG_4_10_14_3_um_filter_41_18]|uniref:Cell division protein FtsA n=3 Tax=Candidatus Ratteibacteria TaxID=2979319 RepID=A0A2M7E879_9BACT|nr:MAG: cell division protein FtsA [Candidatus Omnitrophica bacterium CG1_02_41_171]PIV63957.1 MAG: cell division protein FtsA [bacterium (Candidatus Ratteibacteria) CG01_land_8_20_14_3_00_40_19]PIX76846.1 MAG: cell division protein FtsA [bacterium (Candidatus Ratteibacteria) CG_4_10_14_3_um_filter_41_18]PJA61810.1 MAG: cell division protein FtsA [bacterium (Candidatus Ratteibacteria) CG_4_9_14_3_um_filter_41_21]
MRDDFVTALDLGTSKTCVLLGRESEKGKGEILGVGLVSFSGLKKGVIIDLKKSIASIEKAVEEAERPKNLTAHSLFVNINGNHVKGINCQGTVEISNKNQEILKGDVDNSIQMAKASSISTDRQLIDGICQEYIVDSQGGIEKPIGMFGKKLEAKVFFVTGEKNPIHNVEKSISEAGFGLDAIHLGALASAESVLTEEEKGIGVLLLDLGAGTTEMAIYLNGVIKEISVLPLGGDHITNDLAIGLRVPLTESERLKKNYGWCLESLITDHKLEIPTVNSEGKSFYKVGLTSLAEIIEPRAEEIFFLSKQMLDRSGYANLIGAGVVLTGGTSLLKGIEQLGKKIFKMPVRIGKPRNIVEFEKTINSPIFSTAVGLLDYGLKKRREAGHRPRFSQNNPLVKCYKKVRKTFSDFF